MKNILKLFFTFLICVFLIDYGNLVSTKQNLIEHSKIINPIIASEGGLSEKLYRYIKKQTFTFVYKENNPSKAGEIVEYSLYEDVSLGINNEKRVYITCYVILGSFSFD